MYQAFAGVYDELMKDVDYQAWAEYIESLFKHYNIKVKNIIDLACGTGNMTIPLAKKNYTMVGIDVSQEMLTIAEQKARDQQAKIQWLCQNMINFQGFKEQDAILCTCDGLNYILQEKELKKVFHLVHASLRKGGAFLFDMNSKYKIEKNLDQQVFAYPGEQVSYIWENYYNKESEIIDFVLSFFVKSKKTYQRFNEIHQQRAYSTEGILKYLESTGFQKVQHYAAHTFQKPDLSSERIQYLAIK